MPPTRFQAPSGTRDMYPQDLLRRRYIEKLWRDTAIRHGFEEIDGPTFEHADLYSVKSGEGILSELFQVFSGKDAGELDAIRAGKSAPYALRPEFTPTLARMYAAKAGSLPKPTKWFWMQNCYRAERQQRGRLREFGQWNCDILGSAGAESPEDQDSELIACLVNSLIAAGLGDTKRDDLGNVRVQLSDRRLVASVLLETGMPQGRIVEALGLLDRLEKLSPIEIDEISQRIGLNLESYEKRFHQVMDVFVDGDVVAFGAGWLKHPTDLLGDDGETSPDDLELDIRPLVQLVNGLESLNCRKACTLNPSIVRGLAYYTGTVFEVLADNERAIAGGGRYDNLIELFGGPPTPAVGFGMGDVVLSLVLQDRGLLPEGDALMDALSRPSASYRPDAFVLSAGQTPQDQETAAAQVRPLVARLRRGTESQAYLSRESRKPWDADRYAAASGGAPPLHARSSSKTTKNIGKLLQDAVAQKSKLAVIIESADEATIKDLRTNTQDAARTKLADLPRVIAARLAAAN